MINQEQARKLFEEFIENPSFNTMADVRHFMNLYVDLHNQEWTGIEKEKDSRLEKLIEDSRKTLKATKKIKPNRLSRIEKRLDDIEKQIACSCPPVSDYDIPTWTDLYRPNTTNYELKFPNSSPNEFITHNVRDYR